MFFQYKWSKGAARSSFRCRLNSFVVRSGCREQICLCCFSVRHQSRTTQRKGRERRRDEGGKSSYTILSLLCLSLLLLCPVKFFSQASLHHPIYPYLIYFLFVSQLSHTLLFSTPSLFLKVSSPFLITLLYAHY